MREPERDERESGGPADGGLPAACAAVVGLLRGYADSELTVAERDAVEEHVHRCRACGVALSRAEAEVLRLRDALGPLPLAAPASFTADVMRRVRAEVPRRVRTADDFTPRVMERIRRESRTGSHAATRTARRRLVLGASVLAAAAIALVAWVGAASMRRQPSAATVLAASAASLQRGVHRLPVTDDLELRPGDEVSVHDRGYVRVVLDGGAAGSPAVVEIDGRSTVAFHGGAGDSRFTLREGSCLVRSAMGAIAMTAGDDTGLRFEPGCYRVHVRPVLRYDTVVAQDRLDAVRLDVVEGRALIARGELSPVPVAAGLAAHFDGLSAVQTEPLLGEVQLDRLLQRVQGLAVDGTRAPLRAQAPGDVLGRVVDGRNGAGVAGVTVEVHTARGVQSPVSDADGVFRLRDLADLEGQVAFVRAWVGDDAGAGAGLAHYGPAPVALVREGTGPGAELLLEPLRLQPERRAMGVVVAASGQPLAGASVTPLLIDDLAGGRVQSLAAGEQGAVTDESGRFRLGGLPLKVPAHGRIALLVEHEQFGSVAALDLAGAPSERDRALRIELPPRRPVRLVGLPPAQTVEILESVRNAPASTLLNPRWLRTDALGALEFAAPEGANLWLRNGDMLSVLAPAAGGGSGVLAPQPELAVAAGPAALAMRSDRLGPGSALVAMGGRFASLDADAFAGDQVVRYVSVRDVRGGLARPGARLFFMAGHGELVYLGAFDGTATSVTVPADARDGRLLAVADDGSVGVLDLAAIGGVQTEIEVIRPGDGVLPPPADATAVGVPGEVPIVELEMIEGPFPGLRVERLVEGNERNRVGGLIPGRYRFRCSDGREGEITVTAGTR